nr:hypothetical protein [Streptomyces adustus]
MQHKGGAVIIEIGTAAESSGDPRVIRDLYEWLDRTPAVERHVKLQLTAAPQPGDTMGAADLINMVLNQGFAAGNLVLAYRAWRSARPAAPPITVTAADKIIVLGDASEETLHRLERLLRQTDSGETAERGTTGPEGHEDPRGLRDGDAGGDARESSR